MSKKHFVKPIAVVLSAILWWGRKLLNIMQKTIPLTLVRPWQMVIL